MKSQTKRGRPKLSKDHLEKRRGEISHIALKLFLSEGFDAVSMRRLAKEIGLTPMALYRYFPGKLDILSSLWGYILSLAFEEVSKALPDLHKPEKRLLAASQAYVDYWLHNIDHYHLVFMSSGVTKDAVISFVSDKTIIANYDVFASNIAEIQGQSVNNVAVKQATDGLITHLHGIMHSLITMQGYPWTDAETLVGAAVDAAIGGKKPGVEISVII